MIQKQIYRYEREDGGITVSPKRPPAGIPYQIRWRLIAEEGQAITDGETTVTVIDVQSKKDCAYWQDCERPKDDPEPPEPPTDHFERK